MLLNDFMKEKEYYGKIILGCLQSKGPEKAFAVASDTLHHKRKELNHIYHISVGLGASLYALPAILEKDAQMGDKLMRTIIDFSEINTGMLPFAGGVCRHNTKASLLVSFPKEPTDSLCYAYTGFWDYIGLGFLSPRFDSESFEREKELQIPITEPGNTDPVLITFTSFEAKMNAFITPEFRRYAREVLKPNIFQKIKRVFSILAGKSSGMPYFDDDILAKMMRARKPGTEFSPTQQFIHHPRLANVP